MNFYSRVGAFSSALAIGLGSFGAHSLKKKDKYYREVWNTGTQYHILHSIATLISPLFYAKNSTIIAARCFIGGILLFSGSLYCITLFEEKKIWNYNTFWGFTFHSRLDLFRFTNIK